jgi:hypothetical protein
MRCVPAHDFTVAKALAWHSAIADDPPYQRESSIWSLEKQQLFVDSLLNGYDVPKIYLHDLRGKHPTRVYAVVDGKQRLTTIWRFLTGAFALADDFMIEPANLPDLPEGVSHPRAGQRFEEFDPAWQRVLRQTYLAVVLIQNATETDIEDLFSRLNNGEPLNAAEKRNAIGGDAARLVRSLAGHRFFADRVRFANQRYQHRDAATRLLALEDAALRGAVDLPDLGGRALDDFVRANRRLAPTQRRTLRERVEAELDRLAGVFEARDPLLATQAVVPVLYLITASIPGDAPAGWQAALRRALAQFHDERRAALAHPEDEQDPALREFNRLLHAGANDARNVARRRSILASRLRAADPLLATAIPVPAGTGGATRVHSTAP